MDLFNNNNTENILPYDGKVIYYGRIMSHAEADTFLRELLENIEWKHDEAIIFGKHIVTSRKVAWYADEPYDYTYSRITRQALPWTDTLLELKKLAERVTGIVYNSCLLNLYHDGNEGMAWHSDDEKTLNTEGGIASLSFGAERKFAFKHKTTNAGISMILEHGSALLMTGTTQQHWLHRLPKSTKIKQPRINLTFRCMKP